MRRYNVGRQNPEGGFLHARAEKKLYTKKDALDKLRNLAKRHGGPYKISVKGKEGGTSPARTLKKHMERVDTLIKSGPVGETVRTHTKGGDGPVFLIRTAEIVIKPDLPSGANDWQKPLQNIYKFVFSRISTKAGQKPKPRYPGSYFLGVFNCRQTRQGGSWSYHAWQQALDVGFVNKDQGWQIRRDVEAKFGNALMYVIGPDSGLHATHVHIQVKPDRSSGTPPCAR